MLLHGRWLAGSARMGRCDRLGHAKLCEARGDCREAAVSEISCRERNKLVCLELGTLSFHLRLVSRGVRIRSID